jgi:ribosome-associated protein
MTASRKINAAMLGKELIFVTSRSSGPGGQNVNKVNTKVMLRFDVAGSDVLNEVEKEAVLNKLASRLTVDRVLVLTSQDKRSQLQNKDAVIAKLEVLLEKALKRKKVRKTTKPSKAAIQKRITEKKKRSEKKVYRRKPE